MEKSTVTLKGSQLLGMFGTGQDAGLKNMLEKEVSKAYSEVVVSAKESLKEQLSLKPFEMQHVDVMFNDEIVLPHRDQPPCRRELPQRREPGPDRPGAGEQARQREEAGEVRACLQGHDPRHTGVRHVLRHRPVRGRLRSADAKAGEGRHQHIRRPQHLPAEEGRAGLLQRRREERRGKRRAYRAAERRQLGRQDHDAGHAGTDRHPGAHGLPGAGGSG